MRSLPNGKQALKYLSTTCEQGFPRLPEKKLCSLCYSLEGIISLSHLTVIIFECICAFTGEREPFLQRWKNGWLPCLVPGSLPGLLCGYAAPVKALTSLFCIFQILNERAAKELEQFQMRNAKLQQENEQHSLVCEQLSQENQQKALELKVNMEWHICSFGVPFFIP